MILTRSPLVTSKPPASISHQSQHFSPDDTNADLVRVDLDAERRVLHGERMTSPISLPDVSEGPSTQGSSFTDEAYPAAPSTPERPDGHTIHQPLIKAGADRRRADSSSLFEPADRPLRNTGILNGPAQQENDPMTTLPSQPPLPQKSPKRTQTSRDYISEVLSNHTALTEGLSIGGLIDAQADRHSDLAQNAPSVPDVSFKEASPQKRGGEGWAPAPQEELNLALLTANTQDPGANRKENAETLQSLSSPVLSMVSDDDSLLDEIETAQVHEAKPVSVARSPITPIFAKANSDRLQLAHNLSRPATSILNDVSPHDNLRYHVGRSTSITIPHQSHINEIPLAKKGKLSSGITQRIKALEMFTGRDASASPPRSDQAVSQGFYKSPSSFPTGASPTAHRTREARSPQELEQMYPRPTQFHPTTFEMNADMTSRPWVQGHGDEADIDLPTQKGESISITARIVRPRADPLIGYYTPKQDDIAPVMHRSPLIIQHEKIDHPPPPPLPIQQKTTTPPRPQTSKSMKSSYSTVKSPRRRPSLSYSATQRLPTSEPFNSQRSKISSQRTNTENLASKPLSDTSSVRADEIKSSLTSRFMKRMSGVTDRTRHSIINAITTPGQDVLGSNSLRIDERAEDTSAPLTRTSLSNTDSSSHVVEIGDVNVQFPDTLLWKRRFVRVDDRGFLILTPPTTENNNRGVSRKFHLTEFKKPHVPDHERQELPWSIALDFEDGSNLICACESRYSQKQVLQSKLKLPSNDFEHY